MQYDVIIVLAGGITDDGELHDSSRQRIQAAQKLFSQKLAPKVLMSGKWSLFRERVPRKTEAVAMVAYARKIGIPKKVLLTEEKSNNTTDNAFYTLQLFLRPNNWKKILIVTSDFHISRTTYIFNLFFGPKYSVGYVGAKTNGNFLKRLKWQIREAILLLLTKLCFKDFRPGDYRRLKKLYATDSSVYPHVSIAKAFAKLFPSQPEF